MLRAGWSNEILGPCQPHTISQHMFSLCYSKLVLNMFRSSKEVAPPWSNIWSMSESSCCCWGGPPEPCCPDVAPPVETVPPEPPVCPADPLDPGPESDGWPEPCQAHIPATQCHTAAFFMCVVVIKPQQLFTQTKVEMDSQYTFIASINELFT
jgi:hypothetical protein